VALLEYLGRAKAVLMDDAVSDFRLFSAKMIPHFAQLNETKQTLLLGEGQT
jgi:hypothetical protein